MGKLEKFFASVFGISASEYSGFLWLVTTIVLCSLGLFLVDKFTYNPYDNYEKDAAMLDSILVHMGSIEPAYVERPSQINRFTFDPNKVSYDQLLELGIPTWLAQQLIKYRNKGGRFKGAEDLKKLYNFPDSLYTQIAPYVVVKHVVRKKNVIVAHEPPTFKKKAVVELAPFDLNKADTSMLQTIKGIGGVLSKRIVTYRDKLGGFLARQQLYEVYHLDTATIDSLMQIAYISTDFIPQKISINEVNEKQLAAHPYVSWKQARLIVAYRNQHGDFKNKESLLDVYLINNEWLEKIGPYLSF